MGLLDRIRGAASPDSSVTGLREELHRVRDVRWPIYQNDGHIGQVFEQRRANITQVITGGETGYELSGGYLGLASVRRGKKQAESEAIEVTPLLQALLLEESERERGTLVDLAADKPTEGALLFFVGPGHIFGPPEPVVELAEREPRIPAETAAALQARREEHETRMRWSDPDYRGTLVWVARSDTLLASIASLRLAEPHLLARYGHRPPFGILGMLESRSGEVAVLTPLMIWHDTAATGAAEAG
jgi:hypothetical protein